MNNKSIHIIYTCLFFALTSTIRAQTIQSLDSVEHTVFLIGDAGEPKSKTSEVFDLLLKQVKPVETKSTIVFLGDNIYPGGMPSENETGRESAEKIISYQLNQLKKSRATTYYIPGNHDWNRGKKNGLSHLLNEENIIEKKLDKGDSFIPSNGCPGPVQINVTHNLVLIAIDTQWWLHQHEKPPLKRSDCKEASTADVIKNLKKILAKNKNKNIIVVGHHPLMSRGDHGGYYSLKNHIFPLTNFYKNLFIPLPIIGSIYPFYRSTIGNIQDLAHPKYKYMIRQLNEVFNGYDNLVYAAGHEHNLEYFFKNNQHFIVSGSGSKTSYAKKMKLPNFTSERKGFFKLSYMKNGSVHMETYGIVDGIGKLLFQKVIIQPKES
ncbi:MAG: metallophosphoesterase [Flavobacteriales bacterium]|nr:metallophosphoesterase [Flavobacteriales bacterium]